MQKRGQFYLIAAIIIVSIIVGFTTISNEVKRNPVDKTRIYDMMNELGLENEKILTYNQTIELDDLEKFKEDYTLYLHGNKRIYFIVGDYTSVKAFSYDGIKRDVGYEVVGAKIKITIEEIDYEFDVKDYNFYYIIFKEESGQQFMIESEN